jgi:hypothetical protein
MLPLRAERLCQRGLQGCSVVMELVREWLTQLREPTLPRVELWALGRQRDGLDAVRPGDVMACMGSPAVQHHGHVLGGECLPPFAEKYFKARPLEPWEKQTEAVPRRRLHGRIQPEPFIPVVVDPGRSCTSGTPTPPMPRLEPEAGLIQRPHALHVALDGPQAEVIF